MTKEDWDEVDHRIRGVVGNLVAQLRPANEGEYPHEASPSGRSLGNGIDMEWKSIHARVTGPLAIMALLFGLVGSGMIYVTKQGFAEQAGLLREAIQDHREIVASQDLTACIVSLPMIDRQRFRSYTKREDFQLECPWLRFPARKENGR